MGERQPVRFIRLYQASNPSEQGTILPQIVPAVEAPGEDDPLGFVSVADREVLTLQCRLKALFREQLEDLPQRRSPGGRVALGGAKRHESNLVAPVTIVAPLHLRRDPPRA